MDNKFLQVLFPEAHIVNLPLDKSELAHLHASAAKHNVRQLLYCQLRKLLKESDNNPALHEYLRDQKTFFYNSAVHSINHKIFQDKVLDLLHRNGIPAMVLKGSALAEQVYQNPDSRVSCDIDILVKDSDIERAHILLCRENYRWDEVVPLPFLRLRLHHTTYFPPSSKTHIPVEVHWNFSIPGFFKLSSEEIWGQAACTTEGKYTLNPEMILVLLLMHHHRHAFKELRNAVDIVWAFHRFTSTINWQVLAKEVKRIGLLKTSFLTIRQIEHLWPQESKNLKGLQEFKQQLHTQGKPSLLLSFLTKASLHIEESDFNIRDKILYRLALDHWPTLFSSFIKSILPAPRVIRELFADKKESSLLANYLHFIRWRFFGKKIS